MEYFDDRINEEKEEKEFMNKIGQEVGYTGEECMSCGRSRVIKYGNGYKFCEKCGTDQKTGKIDLQYKQFC